MPTLEERLAKVQQHRTLEQRLIAAQSADTHTAPRDAPGNPFVDAPGNPFVDDNPFRKVEDDNPFRKVDAVQQSSATAAGVAGDAFGQTFANNALAIPSAVGHVAGTGLAGFAAAFEGGVELLLGGDFDFARRSKEQLGKFPASALRSIPKPTVAGLEANFKSLPALFPGGDTFTEARDKRRAEIDAETARGRDQFPNFAVAGDVAGDVATLVTGRLPLAKGLAKAEAKLAGKTPDLFFGKVPTVSTPGARRFADDFINSPKTRALARGAGRSIEAGFEAAALDLLKGDDPFETAGYVAGGQLVGSASLAITKGVFSGGAVKIGIKLALSAGAAAALIQTFKSGTPGGDDSIIQSIESGFDKVSFGMAMGATSIILGSGRLRGTRRGQDFPIISDAISTIPRAAVISLVEKFFDAGPKERQQLESALEKISKNPEAFGNLTLLEAIDKAPGKPTLKL